jgi:hypothetical protein
MVTEDMEWHPKIFVILSCSGDRISEDSVEFENIEEDIYGRDVLTFKCPACGKTHQSLRLG